MVRRRSPADYADFTFHPCFFVFFFIRAPSGTLPPSPSLSRTFRGKDTYRLPAPAWRVNELRQLFCGQLTNVCRRARLLSPLLRHSSVLSRSSEIIGMTLVHRSPYGCKSTPWDVVSAFFLWSDPRGGVAKGSSLNVRTPLRCFV